MHDFYECGVQIVNLEQFYYYYYYYLYVEWACETEPIVEVAGLNAIETITNVQTCDRVCGSWR